MLANEMAELIAVMPLRSARAAAIAAREHRPAKAVPAGAGPLHALGQAGDPGHGQRRAESLPGDGLALLRYVGDDHGADIGPADARNASDDRVSAAGQRVCEYAAR